MNCEYFVSLYIPGVIVFLPPDDLEYLLDYIEPIVICDKEFQEEIDRFPRHKQIFGVYLEKTLLKPERLELFVL